MVKQSVGENLSSLCGNFDCSISTENEKYVKCCFDYVEKALTNANEKLYGKRRKSEKLTISA